MRAALQRHFALGHVSIGSSVGQDIIEGDIPDGAPFDGTSDRASMFDLGQIAKIVFEVADEGTEESGQLDVPLTEALLTKGYGGIRVITDSNMDSHDRSCSPDRLVEARIIVGNAGNVVAVVVASEVWASAITRAALGSDTIIDQAKDCVPWSRR